MFNFALFRARVGGLGHDATPASADGAALDRCVAIGPRQGVAGRLAALEPSIWTGLLFFGRANGPVIFFHLRRQTTKLIYKV